MNPEDPVQIGKTPNGEPIWLNLKDLIPTPDEEAERWDKTLDERERAMVTKAAHLVINNGFLMLQETFLKTAPKRFAEAYQTEPPETAAKILGYLGYSIVQDGLKTIVKIKGKILRDMTANVELRWREHVARRVNQLIRGAKRKQAKLN